MELRMSMRTRGSGVLSSGGKVAVAVWLREGLTSQPTHPRRESFEPEGWDALMSAREEVLWEIHTLPPAGRGPHGRSSCGQRAALHKSTRTDTRGTRPHLDVYRAVLLSTPIESAAARDDSRMATFDNMAAAFCLLRQRQEA